MLYVSTVLPKQPSGNLPIILVHGAANSSIVWTLWQKALASLGWASHAIDLRGHGLSPCDDLSTATMDDYAEDVLSVVSDVGGEAIVMGWSMGGLVAMMAAARGAARKCVALAPSTPSRTVDPSAELRTGVFGPEEYGLTSRDPARQPGMPDLDQAERAIALESLCPESRLARDQRRAGVVIESLPCPLLIVTGTQDKEWPRERYKDLWLEASYHSVENASHWGLVLSSRAVEHAAAVVVNWSLA